MEESHESLYWQRFGLLQDPFAVLNDKYYYPLSSWDTLFERLIHDIEYQSALHIVQGPLGAGKTSFMEQFQRLICDDHPCYQLDADPDLSGQELFHITTQAFALPELSDLSASIDNLFQQQIYYLQRGYKHCVLLIDDAHLLPSPTLNLLLAIVQRQAQNMSLSVVLFSDPMIRAWFSQLDDQEQLDSLNLIELPACDAEEVEAYLEHRFMAAGLTGDFPFNKQDIDQITKQSRGLLENVNQIASELLVGKEEKNDSPMANYLKQPPRVVLSAALALVLAVILAVLWPIEQAIEKQTPMLAEQKPVETVDIEPVDLPTIHLDSERLSVVPNVELVDKVQLSKIPSIEYTQFSDKQIANPPQYAAQKPTPREKQAAVKASRKHYKKQAKKELELERVSNMPGSPVANYQFGIQLLGSFNANNLEQFIKTHRLKGKAKSYKTIRDGKPWYILMYGQYSNRERAVLAVNGLPKDLQQLKPWIRKYDTIRAT